LGFRNELSTYTRGTGILNHIFHSYILYKGTLSTLKTGLIISNIQGSATFYALEQLEERGILFIEPGQPVYNGQVIGENSKPQDLEVNPTKLKHLTNVRSTSKEEYVRLRTPRKFTIEEAISYVRDDMMIEVTPKSIRLRMQILDETARKMAAKRKKTATTLSL